MDYPVAEERGQSINLYMLHAIGGEYRAHHAADNQQVPVDDVDFRKAEIKQVSCHYLCDR